MAMEEKDIYEALGMEMPKKPDEPDQQEPEEHPETVEQQEPGIVEEAPALPEMTVQEPTQEPAQVDVEAQHRAELERVRAEAREQAMAEANAQFAEREKNFFARAGLTDQYRENAAIGSFEEFEQWYVKNQQQRMEQQLRSGTLTPEILQQAANQAVAQQQEQQQQAKQQRDAQFQAAVRTQLEQIRQMDPAMVDLPTIMKSQYAEDFKQAVTDGANFLSAFRIAKRLADAKNQAEAKVRAAAATAAKQQGKQHLQAHGGNGTPNREIEVPPETMAAYRALRPDLSDAEIKKDYNRRRGQGA